MLLCSGYCLARLERLEQELEVYNKLVALFESDETPNILPLVTRAQFNAAMVTGQLGLIDKSIEMYKSFVDRYQDHRDRAIRSQVLKAQCNCAISLRISGHYQRALKHFIAVVRRYDPSIDDSASVLTIVTALTSKTQLETIMELPDVAIESGMLGLTHCKREWDEERFQLHLLLAGAYFMSGDTTSAEDHVSEFLQLLPLVDQPPVRADVEEFLDAMTGQVGRSRTVEIIQESPSSTILSEFVRGRLRQHDPLRGIKEQAEELQEEFSPSGRRVN